MKPKFPVQKLCYMDTDSYVYYIQTDDFYNEIKDDINEWFDTTNYTYSKGNIPLNVNKKLLVNLKMKLEIRSYHILLHSELNYIHIIVTMMLTVL